MVENLKYSANKPKDSNNILNKTRKKNIIILGDYDNKTTYEMLKVVFNATKNMKDIKLIYKPHPSCIIKVPKKYNINLSKKDLYKECINSNLIISSSITSACVEAYINSRSQIVIFLSNDKLNFSPLRNISSVKTFTSERGLKEIINLKKSNKKINSNEFININFSLDKWDYLFNKNL